MIEQLDDSETLTLLQAMAAAHPDYSLAEVQWAALTDLPLPAAEQSHLIRAALNALALDPQQAQLIQALLNSKQLEQFDQKRSKIPAMIALILVLGIKVEFNHTADGSQSLHFEYDASDTAVTEIVKKVEYFLPKKK